MFTATLLIVWNGGAFRGSCTRLQEQLGRWMPASHAPQLSVVGRQDRSFVSTERAFTP